MEAVAAEAGVGKGTVFRRFGDRAALARAVISELRDRAAGAHDPRRGAARPGRAPARAPDRVRRARTSTSSTATAGCCSPPRAATRPACASGVYAFYRTHVALLLREAGCGDARRLPRRRRAGPARAPRRSRYHRGAARALAARELDRRYEDLVRAPPRLIAMSGRPRVRRRGRRRPAGRRLPARRVHRAGRLPRRPPRQAGAGRGPGRRRQDRAGQGAGRTTCSATSCACSATRASTRPRRCTSGTTASSCCGSRPRPRAPAGRPSRTTSSARSSCSRARCCRRSPRPSPSCC